MLAIQKTERFARWLDTLRDRTAAALILARIVRLQEGLFGDVKPVGSGVSELRIDRGPGYRVYFTQRGATVVLLLCGGDKASQKADIEAAKKMVVHLRKSST
jgi:putative addiction module killer protein